MVATRNSASTRGFAAPVSMLRYATRDSSARSANSPWLSPFVIRDRRRLAARGSVPMAQISTDL
jgi:hypothetical protein